MTGVEFMPTLLELLLQPPGNIDTGTGGPKLALRRMFPELASMA
jgi:hypothetical protein